jgi:hypothetical protein
VKAKQISFVAVKVVISAVLIVVLYRRISLLDVQDTVRQCRWELLPILFGILFANTCISTLKWRLFLRANATHLPLGSLFATYLIGSFVNLFMPSNIGGDVYRVYHVGRTGGATVRSFTSVLADRVSGFLALVTIGLVSALAGLGLHGNPRLLIPPVIVFGMIVVALWLVFQQSFLRRVLALLGVRRMAKIENTLDLFLEASAQYRDDRRLLINAMGLSLVFQTLVVVFAYFLAVTLNISVPLLYFFIYVPIISLLEAIPLSIYGTGFRDAGYVLFFAQVGLPKHAAMSMSLMFVAITVIYSGIGGVFLAGRLFGRASAVTPPPDRHSPAG